jgi:hypothetical protein
MNARISPLERRILLAAISLIRDRESDPDFYADVDIPLRTLYDRLYVPGDRPYAIERRNQRQAQRRALERMHKAGLVWPIALAWVSVTDGVVLRWQGGGRRKRRADDPPWSRGCDTPRWRLITLTDLGVKLALLLEAESGGAS